MTRTAWYVVAAIVIIFLIWLGYSTYFKKPKTPETGTSGTSGGASSGAGSARNDNFPLGIGSYGSRVRNLQYILNKYYGTTLDEDGDLGPLTLAQIQAKFGVTQVTENKYQSIVNPFNIPFID